MSYLQNQSLAGDQSTAVIKEGLRVLLTECLQANFEDTILVIYDEGFQAFLNPLVEIATQAKLRITFICFPKIYQRAVISWAGGDEHEIDLPVGITSACGEASVILNCLDGDLETGSLRGAILNRLRPRECRLAHIPGMSEKILCILTETPIQEVLDSAQNVAWALGEAREGNLISFDREGQECILHFELEGWDNEPMMSPGVIFPGSWGNSPPGEVFCCPDPAGVEGSVCINGSIPGQALSPEDSTVLHFKTGHLIDWCPKNTRVAHFLEEQKSAAAGRNDPNWNTFAELGIGLNPAVTKLTGNSLLDEKALGTVHVAVGDNRTFGHKIQSFIHADLVINDPTLELDNRKVLDRGKLLVDELKAFRLQAIRAPILFASTTRLGFRDAKLEFRSNVISRKLVSAGRIGYVPILELAEDRWLLEIIHDAWQGVEGSAVTYAHLQSFNLHDNVDESRLQYALSVLHHYRILTLETSRETNSRTANQSGSRGSSVRQHRAGSR